MQKIEAKIVRPATHSFGNRVETGVVEFVYPEDTEDPIDWPGVFIRGDSALMYYAPALEYILTKVAEDDSVLDVMYLNACKGLVDLLRECNANNMEENDD